MFDSFAWDRKTLIGDDYTLYTMQSFLLKIWKQFPLWLKILSARLLRPKYMVAVAAVIFDQQGHILLGKHTYRKKHPWGLLAGSLEYGEDPEEAIIRELREETGFDIEVKQLLKAVSAKEDHHISLIYLCEIVGGTFQPSPEISIFGNFPSDDLPDVLYTERVLIVQLVEQLKGAALKSG